MARILKRPMFRRGGMPSSEGVAAVRPKYMGGGMSGIMTGINPTAGLTPRVGYADGPQPNFMGGVPIVEKPGFFKGLYQKINPTTSEIVSKLKEAENATPLMEDIFSPAELNFRSKEEEMEFYEKYPELKPKVEPELKPKVTIEGNPKTTSGQSDLESIKDYMKMFEAAAAGDPDEAKRSKYLELAKFGANLIAQPGGDLTGAIGKAASSSIGGLSKQMADEQAAKRQGKLMGLKAGLDKTDMGEFGKKIKALAKLSGQSLESVAKKFLSGDGDFDKEYLVAAEQAGVEAGAGRKTYLQNIKAMFSKNPNIAARLNKPFPKKNPVPNEYYVLPNGQFTRYVNGEKLKPSEPGFYDEEA